MFTAATIGTVRAPSRLDAFEQGLTRLLGSHALAGVYQRIDAAADARVYDLHLTGKGWSTPHGKSYYAFEPIHAQLDTLAERAGVWVDIENGHNAARIRVTTQPRKGGHAFLHDPAAPGGGWTIRTWAREMEASTGPRQGQIATVHFGAVPQVDGFPTFGEQRPGVATVARADRRRRG